MKREKNSGINGRNYGKKLSQKQIKKKMCSIDKEFMIEAIVQAEIALKNGEIPVGCVFVIDDTIVAKGHNLTNETKNGTMHAEIVAINNLIYDQELSQEAIKQSRLYVTCEPCIMCAAALSLIGVNKVYFGCRNERFGGNGSIISLHQNEILPKYHSYSIVPGLMEEYAIKLFQDFYIGENKRAPIAKRKRKQEK